MEVSPRSTIEISFYVWVCLVGRHPALAQRQRKIWELRTWCQARARVGSPCGLHWPSARAGAPKHSSDKTQTQKQRHLWLIWGWFPALVRCWFEFIVNCGFGPSSLWDSVWCSPAWVVVSSNTSKSDYFCEKHCLLVFYDLKLCLSQWQYFIINWRNHQSTRILDSIQLWWVS